MSLGQSAQQADANRSRAGGRTGVWLVGGRGSIGITTTVGIAALARGLTPPTGLVTATRELADVPLIGMDQLVVGGHDITQTPLVVRARELSESGMLPRHIVEAVGADLDRADQETRPGVAAHELAAGQAVAVDRLVADIEDFQRRQDLARIIMIDLSSTEPLPEDVPELHDVDRLEAALAEPGRSVLPPSALYALAAIRTGSPLACFTPSASVTVPVLAELAATAIPYAGQDGKTGQTLLRTALAPMFVRRGFHVLSWAGANVLGGGDGATLADPHAVRSKLDSKNRGLRSLVGDHVVTPLHIDNVPDMGDIKTAWDHIHVEGFLGSRVTLQTSWSAYDSMLAAPLVIDLVRLLALAADTGCRGPVPELGFFFKDPWGSNLHDYGLQAEQLYAWAHERAGLLTPGAPADPSGITSTLDPVSSTSNASTR